MISMPKSLNRLAWMAVLPLFACGSPQTNLPKTAIISTTLCADGYLHSLPGIETRLAALSWQSRSGLSQTPQHLRALPQTDNDLERRLNWSSGIQVSSAGRGGDIDLKWGEDFQTVWDNLDLLASNLNVTDPAATLQARLSSLKPPTTSPLILYLDRSGATAGPGTFVDAVINAAGGTNIIKTAGWQSPDTETLIGLQPDIILSSFLDSNYVGVNDRTLRHAALEDKIRSIPQINLPGRYWTCAGPGLIDAAEHLNQAILAL